MRVGRRLGWQWCDGNDPPEVKQIFAGSRRRILDTETHTPRRDQNVHRVQNAENAAQVFAREAVGNGDAAWTEIGRMMISFVFVSLYEHALDFAA